MARLRLYKRGAVWWVDGKVAGRRIRESTRETDKGHAETYATRREAEERRRAEFGDEAVITFGAATGIYLDAGKSERYLTPIFQKWEHKLIKDIKPGNVHDLALELYPNAGPATRNRQVISPVQAIINHAAKRGYCSPIRIERYFVPTPERTVASMDWLRKFMAAAKPELGALAQFMAMTGARITEAVNLEWRDMNLQAGTAYLRKTKNGDPRQVALPPPLLVTLANLKGKREGRVFGYPHRSGPQRPWETAEKRAGIPHISPHNAGRRLFATAMIQAGVDPVTVAKAGGWKSVRMVVDVYAQPADTTEAVNRVFGNSESQPSVHKGVRR
jgi:integrase